MPATRDLLRSQITYSEAREKETNILHELTYPALAKAFKDRIEGKGSIIQTVVAHHLCAQPSQVHVSHQSQWINGSFNLCVPAWVQNRGRRDARKVVMRFPLPYKMAESFRHGNGDEKIRCEAATYAWLNQECPSIPTPTLLGFGLSSGQKFTALANVSLLTRCIHYLKQWILSLLRYPVPCQYTRHQMSAPDGLEVGYLLLDYIEDGKMLSESYAEQYHNATLRANLFRDLANIQLTLARKPLPRIGSLSVNDNGVVSLTNRPFTLEVCQLENDCLAIDMPRAMTYSTVDSYVLDLLSLHDDRLRYQPNGVTSFHDGISQMSALSTMRTVFSGFFDRRLRNGPFVLTFTDMHTSNFLVDDNWRITSVIDLEWACVRPVEMQHPPYWLTSQAVDRIDEAQYSEISKEFIDIVQQEEMKTMHQQSELAQQSLAYGELLKKSWDKGTFWYCLALDSPTGLHHIFYNRILPRYQVLDRDNFDKAFYTVAPSFWGHEAWDLMADKVEEKKEYDERLQDAFQVTAD